MRDKVGVANSKSNSGSFSSIFMHADEVDKFLMVLGFLGSLGDGFSIPVMLVITSKIVNNLGGGASSDPDLFLQNINKDSPYGSAEFNKFGEFAVHGMWDICCMFFRRILLDENRGEASVENEIKVPNFLMNFALFIGSYITAFILMWRLAIVGFPFILFLIIPGIMYGRILMVLARKMREEYNKAGNIAEQAISSIRTVYSFVGERKTMDEFSEALQGSVKLGLKQGLAKGVAIGSNGVTFAVWSFMAWYGSRLVMYHGGQGGTIFAVGASINIGGLALGVGLSNMKYFSEAFSAGERIIEVIMRVPKIDSDNMNGEILEKVSGEVEFKNVEFAYPSRPETVICKDFTLKVPAGKTVALVGGSGSGKSTVIALLERFYDPLGGEILLDGVAIKKLQLKWLRSQMGLVSQEPCLFATSIKENILFGKEDATLEQVMDAAKAANAHNFISQLPQGYDTQVSTVVPVGERGVQISGGQKQRIAIARAIIKAPRILLLDEATSALDSESERVVQEALDKAALGRTTIVIAHRLSTIRNADVIAVVQNGKITETGSHDELINNENRLYSSLVRLQHTGKKTGLDEDSKLSHITNRDSNNLSSHGGRSNSSRRLSFVSRSSSANSTSGKGVSGELNITEQHFPVPSFWRLLLLNLPEWKQAILGCTSAMLFGAVQPVFAFMMGSMISVYFSTDHDSIRSKTRFYALFFLGLALFTFLVNVCQHYNFAAMGEYLTKRRIRKRMLSKFWRLKSGWAFIQSENSSGRCAHASPKDANVVRSLVGGSDGSSRQALSASCNSVHDGFDYRIG
ncbi:hypothetical protein GIB67_035710 [Kingdonia uniflora]|uniref:Uncharacterized protein n=1 Tax=Kingdonia uniflora TaxID=39325 RepID=A0A7J7M5L4_9MAGN|nr:hypothetical protein GIB67_035710 [Kingdonia uniflora]